MIDGSWDTLNWVGAGLTFAVMMYALLSAAERGGWHTFLVPVILFAGMAGFLFATAAPTYSYMEREHWTTVIQREANEAEVERLVSERMAQLTTNLEAELPHYCDRRYSLRRTDSQTRHCYVIEVNRLMENYANQSECGRIDAYNRERNIDALPCELK